MMNNTLINHREMVANFGPSKAADVILAADAFCTANQADPERLRQIVNNPDLLTLALDKMHQHLGEYGFAHTERFEPLIKQWLLSYCESESDKARLEIKRESYAPVNLGAAYHDGHLYYPVQTLLKTVVTGPGGEKREAERIDIVVLRSDRTLQSIEESVDEFGKLSGIYRLSDGTLLQKKPTASPHATWSWEKIQDYLNCDYMPQDLSTLALKVHKHLKSRVWLPQDADYWLLTFTAITSYLQPIFDAVPLILLHGERGTGKSELGAAMTEVSCNAVMIGQSSASTMIRLMDEARGLVVIDDLESIGVTGGAGGKEKFSEMVQVLKISYKKSSATKIVTNNRRKTEIMNFFGIKIVSNTNGVDAILGSRMLKVSTQNMREDALDEFLSRKGLSSQELSEMKNDLHIWAFDHVEVVDRYYQVEVAGSTQRDEEIAAPIRVLARMSGIPEAYTKVNEALSSQRQKKGVFKSADQALDYVMEKMAEEGVREFTLMEVSLRLRLAMGVSGFTKKSRPLWSKPEWISRRLRETGWIADELKRKNLFGYQMKVFSMSDDMRIRKGAVGTHRRGAFDFCQGCMNCHYKLTHCDILPYRAKREGL